jgi:fucose permease
VAGFSYKDMLKACYSPLFLFMAFCMILTAATELGTNQWIAALMSNVSDNPILLLVWISGIMAIARQFGGTFVHNAKSTLILLFSAIFAFIGLIMMGYASGTMIFAAAGVFALGIAFFWPTMLGFVSENIPQSGALGLAIMGGIGFLGGAIAQPVLGAIFDAQTLSAIPGEHTVEILKNAAAGSAEATLLANAQLAGGANTLKYVAILPAVLIAAFVYLHLRKNKKAEYVCYPIVDA